MCGKSQGPPANGASLDRFLRVGEIFLCLISINSPTCFARRGITDNFIQEEVLGHVQIRGKVPENRNSIWTKLGHFVFE